MTTEAPTVIVYGPPASGKTTASQALKKHFGCTHVVDEWTRDGVARLGALHLMTGGYEEAHRGGIVLMDEDGNVYDDVRVMSINEALTEANLQIVEMWFGGVRDNGKPAALGVMHTLAPPPVKMHSGGVVKSAPDHLMGEKTSGSILPSSVDKWPCPAALGAQNGEEYLPNFHALASVSPRQAWKTVSDWLKKGKLSVHGHPDPWIADLSEQHPEKAEVPSLGTDLITAAEEAADYVRAHPHSAPDMYRSITMMADFVHANNVRAGWWTDLNTGQDLHGKRNIGELLMLCVTELAEAMEGHRKDLPDDKLPHRPMFRVELIDTLIRILDILGSEQNDEHPAGEIFREKLDFNRNREDHKPENRRGENGKKI